ncbi:MULTISPECIES: HAMP domain-containing sensor histidine kinase [Bacillus]|uniref:HAMP domain-containing sensor histidine kinase n=1 Tax=Bacillus TaxID=1386 RepID=UPI000D042870|nr:HAMP domain-containing sensor histidine kinase [Bacillus pumilus]MCY7435967.1 HAMP domain-containing histidine kinase [Bacillus pumilus]MCY7502253.1 HAMP domain-containing histidine kinase [Bacillus pumilus]MCY7527197.1 HAMP domain-containing histidine kinase [Bacillus pumilus]MDR6747949.1 signal transduction histidine kinase [Bacillus pumilus]MED4437876.1 HAMP domain-containing sensor histidine kinase [Bacillus pumilus]
MNLRAKLFFHFVGQMFIVIAILIIGNTFSDNLYLKKYYENMAETGLTKADGDTLMSWLYFNEDGKMEADDQLKQAVRKRDGWLQVIDSKKDNVYSYHRPKSIPTSYQKDEMIKIFEKRQYKDYKMYFWPIEIDQKSFIVLYGFKTNSTKVANYLKQHEKDLAALSQYSVETKEFLKRMNGSVHLFNDEGKYLQGIRANTNLKHEVTDVELLKYQSKPWEFRSDLSYIRVNKNLYIIISVPNKVYSPDGLYDKETDALNQYTTILIAGLAITIIIVMTLWYSYRYGLPIYHIIRWLIFLSRNKLQEPTNRKGIPISKNKKGRIKREYRLFEDILKTMDQLTLTLKENEANRRKIQTTREEWIAGLSHDLKTPLSTIYGYGLMLESDQYQWSKEEVMEMGQVIREKSEYMSTLIEDLNLTYRLKNGALPINRKPVELGEFLASIMDEFSRSSFSEDFPSSFEDQTDGVMFEIDKAWFRRVIENLLANAVKHNQKGTHITATLSETNEEVRIEMKDNGCGMAQETVDHLFNRYYRGTNTNDPTNGTGLGLAIAKELVLLHDGDIQVESEQGAGTTIAIILKKSPPVK